MITGDYSKYPPSYTFPMCLHALASARHSVWMLIVFADRHMKSVLFLILFPIAGRISSEGFQSRMWRTDCSQSLQYIVACALPLLSLLLLLSSCRICLSSDLHCCLLLCYCFSSLHSIHWHLYTGENSIETTPLCSMNVCKYLILTWSAETPLMLTSSITWPVIPTTLVWKAATILLDC